MTLIHIPFVFLILFVIRHDDNWSSCVWNSHTGEHVSKSSLCNAASICSLLTPRLSFQRCSGFKVPEMFQLLQSIGDGYVWVWWCTDRKKEILFKKQALNICWNSCCLFLSASVQVLKSLEVNPFWSEFSFQWRTHFLLAVFNWW